MNTLYLRSETGREALLGGFAAAFPLLLLLPPPHQAHFQSLHQAHFQSLSHLLSLCFLANRVSAHSDYLDLGELDELDLLHAARLALLLPL